MSTETMLTLLWLKRLPFWLILVMRELPESGDAYICQMLIPTVLGAASLALPFLILAIIPEIRSWWLGVVLTGLLIYLFMGVMGYISFEGRNYGPWQNRGAW